MLQNSIILYYHGIYYLILTTPTAHFLLGLCIALYSHKIILQQFVVYQQCILINDDAM